MGHLVHRIYGPGKTPIKNGTSPPCSPWPKTYNYRKSRGPTNSSFIIKYRNFVITGHFVAPRMWLREGPDIKGTSPRCLPWLKTYNCQKSRGSNNYCFFVTKYKIFVLMGRFVAPRMWPMEGRNKREHH